MQPPQQQPEGILRRRQKWGGGGALSSAVEDDDGGGDGDMLPLPPLPPLLVPATAPSSSSQLYYGGAASEKSLILREDDDEEEDDSTTLSSMATDYNLRGLHLRLKEFLVRSAHRSRQYYLAERRRIRKMSWASILLPVWKVAFAIVAFLDMALCWPAVVEGWNASVIASEQVKTTTSSDGKGNVSSKNASLFSPSSDVCPRDDSGDSGSGNATPYRASSDSAASASCRGGGGGTFSNSAPLLWIVGPLFCLLCVVEAAVRAREARALAIEMNALDKFEQKLTRVYTSTRTSLSSFGSFAPGKMLFHRVKSDAVLDEVLARSTLRTWIPVASVVFFWLALLPVSDFRNYGCGNDGGALATMWIASSIRRVSALSELAQRHLEAAIWNWALPFKLYQPRRFYMRVRQLLRWIRYLRYAGPLLRMAFKLFDQFYNLTITWRQSLTAKTEKAKRVARRSMLFEDLQRIESLTKVHTALATLPSQLFRRGVSGGGAGGWSSQAKLSEEVGNLLAEKQREGRRMREQLMKLKEDIGRSFVSTSELYDRVVLLTQDMKAAIGNATLLSSHHLISPHSRFGVFWRVTVTNCLLLEMFRLNASWHLSGTFNITLTQIVSRFIAECDPKVMHRRFGFVTKWAEDVRRSVANVVPLIPPAAEDWTKTICVPSSATSKLVLKLGGAVESFIDVVGFLDIFIWFQTGELDAKGVVVPKPFFYRCIMPGTLVQVLDHPTLPDILPALIAQAMDAAEAAGWSRVIRWVLAIVPAFVMLVVHPLNTYFFRHHNKCEGMLRYAESCGMLAPVSKHSTANLLYGGGGSLHAIPSYPSQIGMSLNDSAAFPSPRPSRKVFQPQPQPNPPFNDYLAADQQDESYSFCYGALQY